MPHTDVECCTGLWASAHSRREALLDYITRAGGLATLMDYRRTQDYDSDKLVDQYLNQPEVKVHLIILDLPSCCRLPTENIEDASRAGQLSCQDLP